VSKGICQKEPDLKRDYYKQIEQFANVLSIIQTDYVDSEGIDPKELIYGAMEGMVSKLDSYSQFMEPEEYREMKMETEGEFGGVGVEITLKDGLLTVVSPLEGTPASKAGIMAGDRIVKIDDKSTKDIKLHEAVKKLRGRPGTDVNITVLREDEKKLLDFNITRSLIKIESIKQAEIIDYMDNIGYIKLVEFQEKTPMDLDAALARLKAEGMKSLILDLRNNPGGLLDVAVIVAERFIEKGEVVVSTRGRLSNQNIVFKSQGKNLYTDFPMIVLVNNGSASASEIVAGAMQDHKRGIVMGTKTFGKGSVQTVIPLRDGSALRLTTAKYYTPKNKMIHAKGIMPDVIVEKENIIAQNKEDIFEAMDAIEAQPAPKERRPSKKADKPKEKNIELKPESDMPAYDNQLARAVDLLKGLNVYRDFFLKKGPIGENK
jgi:carboxyl-terminal processing protease